MAAIPTNDGKEAVAAIISNSPSTGDDGDAAYTYSQYKVSASGLDA
jgi:hypothetical protein